MGEDVLDYSNGTSMKEVRKEWASWLAGVFGSSAVILGTYTFRNPDTKKHPTWTVLGKQYVSRAGLWLQSKLEANGSSAIVVVEEGTDTRRLHLHSLQSLDLRSAQIVEMEWRRLHGHVALRRVRSREGVSMYVTKYVTKSDILFYAGGPLFSSYRDGGLRRESSATKLTLDTRPPRLILELTPERGLAENRAKRLD